MADPRVALRRSCRRSVARGMLSQQDLMEASTHLQPTYSAANLVFPDPDHSDSLRSEKSANYPRALPIALNFHGPVSAICLRKPKASRAPVPETPVHKYGNLLFGKPKVRPPRDRPWVHFPSAYRRSHKNESQSQFGRTVAHRSDLRHERASFSCWGSLQLPHCGDQR